MYEVSIHIVGEKYGKRDVSLFHPPSSSSQLPCLSMGALALSLQNRLKELSRYWFLFDDETTLHLLKDGIVGIELAQRLFIPFSPLSEDNHSCKNLFLTSLSLPTPFRVPSILQNFMLSLFGFFNLL